MKMRVWIAALMLVGTVSLLNAAADQFAGAWSGTWEGGGAGGTLALNISADVTGGDVAVGQDAGDYTSKFSSVTIEGNRMTARYPYTPDPQADIVLTGTFEGGAASGDWNMVEKGGSTAFTTGTWKVARK